MTTKYIIIILVAGLLLTLFIFIQNNTSPSSDSPTTYSVLSNKEFAAYVTENDATVIDVRTPEEFASGHLSGAININSAAPDFQEQINALDKNDTYAIYCRSGNRSATALKIMRSQNFVSVVELDGGIIAWERSRLPVCTGSITC